jgi:glycosyltransferase involved in cell wall biosynthesis
MNNQNKTPIVSVILPVLNGEYFIAPAVKSILKQKYTDFELILLDDGSKDRTLEIVTKIADERVKIISDGVCKGLAARLNIGIDLAVGRYIARMDADDLSFSQRLEKQVAFLEAHPDIDLVSSRALLFQDKSFDMLGTLPYRQNHDEISACPWKGFYMPHPSWMGRADWFRRFRYRWPEVVRAEDQELLLRALPDSKFHCLPEVLLAYRCGDFNLRKSLLARKNLLNSQLLLFRQRGEIGNAVKALFTAGLKSAIDTAFFRSGNKWRFLTGKNRPSAMLEREFHDLIKNCNCRDGEHRS